MNRTEYEALEGRDLAKSFGLEGIVFMKNRDVPHRVLLRHRGLRGFSRTIAEIHDSHRSENYVVYKHLNNKLTPLFMIQDGTLVPKAKMTNELMREYFPDQSNNRIKRMVRAYKHQ